MRYCAYALSGSLIIYALSQNFISPLFAFITNQKAIGPQRGISPMLQANGLLISFVKLTIWAPLVEEIMFRYWLVKKRNEIIISVSVILAIVALRNNSLYENYTYTVALAIFLISLLILLLFKNLIPVNLNVSKPLLIWISAIMFGLLHLANFPLSASNWFLYLPYIFPQIFTGVLFGQLRMKHGFGYCVAVHSIINLFSFLSAWLTM